uniref:UvrD-helicase domain-containing protein n=1 Tax=uncultured Methanobrevibacter sp. TaxID=253161 RepID=UPI002606B07B
MSISNHKNKRKIIELVCKKYITITSKGKLKFKSPLNDAIEEEYISDDDALSISLELMYSIRNYGFSETDVIDELNDLILKVTEYNLSENANIKNSVLFFKDYSYENNLLSEYLGGIFPDEEINVEDNKPQINKPNDIKKYFDHFSHEDLCYIMDMNPDLTYVKDKVLKKQIAGEFSKYDFDVLRLVDASSSDIKKYLESLVGKSSGNQPNNLELEKGKQNKEDAEHRKKQVAIRNVMSSTIQKENKQLNSKNEKRFKKINSNLNNNSFNAKKDVVNESKDILPNDMGKLILKGMSKKEFEELIQKIRLFNYKKLQSMISLKTEYSQIYHIISSENLDKINNDIKRFRYYYENFNKIEDSIKIIGKIKQKEDLINKFYMKLTEKSFSDINSSNIIFEFKEIYEIVYAIKKYPYCLKDKIIDEFANLEYFIQNYEQLLDNYGFKTSNYMKKMELIVKINSFNDKNLYEMASLKKEYSEIYHELSTNFNEFYYNTEVLVFIANFECCVQAVDLINNIRQNENLINNFCAEINCGEFLSNSIRNKLIVEFKECYDFASQIYSFPEWFEYIIFNEFNNFERFMGYYNDLLNYQNYQNTRISNLNSIVRINEKYIENEIGNHKTFFKDIKDKNKKKAIITDEDNVKVVAGAGAGKTFIIQKKINYLIEKKRVDPKKILCLCYTGKGANDLKEKINNEKVNIFTFHGFCREVSQNCDKYRPTDDKLLDDVINNYIRKVIDDDDKLNEILEYFNYYVKNPIKHEFDTIEEYKEFKRGFELKTLRNKYDFYNGYQKQSYKGEVVRSLEELVIANFLFMHNINYIYEDTYEHEFLTPIICDFIGSYNYFCLNRDLNKDFDDLIKFKKFEKSLNSYQPDFYLPDKQIYIEHFGVARNNIAYWLKGDAQKKYTEDMNFKLDLHKLYNTNLITTFSYYMTEGSLLDELRESLSGYFELKERDKKEIFDIIINNNRSEDFKHFKMLLKSFINIFEAKNLPKSKLDDFKKEN